MLAEQVRATGKLGGKAFTGVASRVEGVHSAVAKRAFGATGPLGRPAHVLHDAVAGSVYGVLSVVGSVAGAAAGEALALMVPPASAAGVSAGRTPLGNQVLAALNGFLGDRLAAEDDPLAIRMAVRVEGCDVPLDTGRLKAVFPTAGPKLAVLAHGLAETEHSWLATGTEGGFGLFLADLGYTPVFIRYNSGRHVSDNGRELASLLGELVNAWPVAPAELLLLGHSMGGLVIRSACHYGAGEDWAKVVRRVVYLGTPHLGAPLARAAGFSGWALSRLPETRPFAPLLNGSSAGVKDLRFGYLIEEEWSGCDPDACRRNHRVDVPLLASADHVAISATITEDPHSPIGAVVGDLLVQPASAHGKHHRGRHIPFPAEGRHHLGGLTHFDLLRHPAVRSELEVLLTS